MSTEHDDNPEELEEATVVDETPPSPGTMRPGPGLPEAMLWIGCLVIGQLGFGFAVNSVLDVVSGGAPDVLLDKLGADGVLTANFLPMFLCLPLLFAFGLWRLRPQPFRKLNLSPPSVTQTVVLLGTTGAISWLCATLLSVIQPIFLQRLMDTHPDMGEVLMQNVEFTFLLFRDASFPLLIVYVGVIPAVNEEFLFRGLLGRGLVARWGVIGGVSLTSLLFAAVHFYPPQVVSLVPLAILMHMAYLATRSIWAPVLVHLVNNALAVIQLKLSAQEFDPLAAPNLTFQEWLAMVIGAAIGVFGAVTLNSVRTEYVDASGNIVQPAFPTAEAPPKHLGLHRSARFSASLVLVFLAILIVESYYFWRLLQAEPVDAVLF